MSNVVGHLIPIASTHEWKIKNFSSYTDFYRGKFIDSPTFKTFGQDPKDLSKIVILQWRLGLFPNGHMNNDTEQTEFVSICLESCNNFAVATKYSLGIVGVHRHNNITKSNYAGKVFHANRVSWGWAFATKEMVLSRYSGLLVNDTLTISCSIFDTRIVDMEIEVRSVTPEMVDYFEKHALRGEASDVTCIVGGKKIKLHKNILSSVSPTLRETFEQDDETRVFHEKDFEFKVMLEFFRYAYTKKVENIDAIVVELFVAAEKYRVKELAKLCEETLCGHLIMDTAFGLYEVAVRRKMRTLKAKVLDFIRANLTTLLQRKEFNELSPDVKNELLKYIGYVERKRY